MKFKPGDLVKVENGMINLELVSGAWKHRKSRSLGTVLESWVVDFVRDEVDKPIYMYKVLVDGKIETKNENSVHNIEESND